MKTLTTVVIALALAVATSVAQEISSTAASDNRAHMMSPGLQSVSFDQVVQRIVQRERETVERMQHLHPMVETYIQTLRSDADHRAIPASDRYFLRRLDLSDGADGSFMPAPPIIKRLLHGVARLEKTEFDARGFAQMMLVDDDFQASAYNFTLVRREFLGEVRCLVLDVQPKKDTGDGRFMGRIWVEDRDYNIVRLNGTYSPQRSNSYYFHFDSWRLNLRPGIWLPVYVYSEESGRNARYARPFHFKSQSRVWGYDLKQSGRRNEFAEIEIDPLDNVRDQSQGVQDPTPLQAQRLWERQAEDNAVERLEKVGLLAPEGEVDKVLETVVYNLAVTSNLDIVPEVRCRVLLTSPLESFTIGHTIVVSRGLLDVLPDEPALAMVLAHEVGHIALGHRVDTQLSFTDRFFFPDEKTLAHLDFNRDHDQEAAADREALSLLEHSPYKDKLASAGLFLKTLQARAPELKNLIHAHLGNGLAGGSALRMSALLHAAPTLNPRSVDQIAALPLGARIKLDPWSDRVELAKNGPERVLFADEKKPFEVMPFFPHLTRLPASSGETVASLPLGK